MKSGGKKIEKIELYEGMTTGEGATRMVQMTGTDVRLNQVIVKLNQIIDYIESLEKER
jgi:hypothetical protein